MNKRQRDLVSQRAWNSWKEDPHSFYLKKVSREKWNQFAALWDENRGYEMTGWYKMFHDSRLRNTLGLREYPFRALLVEFQKIDRRADHSPIMQNISVGGPEKCE